ncbi:MAG TPA: hypothetical protein VHC95_08785 [Opitutales bacterium]|nr:hypothetical protein [Opitutales bacterium]
MSDDTPPVPVPPPLGSVSSSAPSDAPAGGLDFSAIPEVSVPPSSNLILGIIGGLAAAVIGAIIWAAIAVVANLEVGYVAVGLAFLVGLAIRNLGRGQDIVYGVAGAVCSFLGIALGKVFTLIWVVADQEQVSVLDVFTHLDWGKAFQVIGDNLGPVDFLFGIFALCLGFKYSIRPPSQ